MTQAAATTRIKNATVLRSTLLHFNKLLLRYYLPFSKVSQCVNLTEDRNETTTTITEAVHTLVPVLSPTLGHDREGAVLVPRQTCSRASSTTYRSTIAAEALQNWKHLSSKSIIISVCCEYQRRRGSRHHRWQAGRRRGHILAEAQKLM
ncbi:MAG: hypothetical protein BJ554DRAFT_656, partial [Olpidium bornovanus]